MSDEPPSPLERAARITTLTGTAVIAVLAGVLCWLAWVAFGSALAVAAALALAGLAALALYSGLRRYRAAVSGRVGPRNEPDRLEAGHRRLLDNARDIIFRYRLQPERGFEYVNEAATRIVGYTPSEHYADPDLGLAIVHPDDREELLQAMADEADFSGPKVRRWIHKDGRVVWTDQRLTPIHDADGCLVAIEGIARDITEQVIAQNELREAKEALRAVIQAAPLAIVSLDRRGHVRTWNAAAERIFGWSEEEVLDGPPPFVSDEDRDEFHALRDRVLAGHRVSGVEVQRRTRAGHPIDVAVWAAPLHDSEGDVSGIMALLEDVTDRQAIERQLFLSQRLESVGRLAGGVAHDFNNLLTAVLGNCELLLGELEPGDPRRSEVEEIQASAERAASLTRQLLAFSRKQVLKPQQLDLNAVVEETEKMLRRLIGEDIDLITVRDPELGRIEADRAQLEQVLMNLAVNARDAMPQGGILTIETSNVDLDEDYARQHIAVNPGPYVMLAVSDTGVGLDPEAQTRIFEPFFTTKERSEAHGLGLATVYGIVKQSGGNIWVYSEPGHGTTFKIYLPRVSQAAESHARRTPPPTSSTTGTETVLLVEDEPSLRRVAREVLQRNGYAVLGASDGTEALRIARDHHGPIDLLLTDVILPGANGVELAERLTAIRPATRVLYMSGYTEEGIVQKGVLRRGTAFLAKPFGSGELCGKVREVLDAD